MNPTAFTILCVSLTACIVWGILSKNRLQRRVTLSISIIVCAIQLWCMLLIPRLLSVIGAEAFKGHYPPEYVQVIDKVSGLVGCLGSLMILTCFALYQLSREKKSK